MEKFVYKIEQQVENAFFNNLIINTCNPIKDLHENNIIVNKLGLTNSSSKIFIETELIMVHSIDYDNNKIILELDDIHQHFFNLLDSHCSNLLINLINEDNINDLNSSIKNISNSKFDTINYMPMLDGKYLKLKIFPNTTIKLNGIDAKLNNINTNDTVRLVLSLDQILLLINFNSNNIIDLEAKTKIYCYFIDTHKVTNYVNEQRENITEWNFSSINPNKIFIKTNLLETDNADFKTDLPKNINSYAKKHHYDTHNQPNSHNNPILSNLPNSPDLLDSPDSPDLSDSSDLSNSSTLSCSSISNLIQSDDGDDDGDDNNHNVSTNSINKHDESNLQNNNNVINDDLILNKICDISMEPDTNLMPKTKSLRAKSTVVKTKPITVKTKPIPKSKSKQKQTTIEKVNLTVGLLSDQQTQQTQTQQVQTQQASNNKIIIETMNLIDSSNMINKKKKCGRPKKIIN